MSGNKTQKNVEDSDFFLLDGASSQAPIIAPELETQKRIAADKNRSIAGRCGYSKEQIARCLKALTVKSIHQEKEGVEHLAYLLRRKEAIKKSFIGTVEAHERPEIMKLRFDSERSLVEEIPMALREPLYGLYLHHVEGSVMRRGRAWIAFDLMNAPELKRPYPFDKPASGKSFSQKGGKDPSIPDVPYLLGELTWPQAKSRFKEVDIALLPVGAIEQHGPHLPLDADAFDANYLARKIAEACRNPKPIVLPLVAYGVSYHHEDFSGTISVSPETLSQLIYEIGMSASRHGVTKLIIINGHGGNSPALATRPDLVDLDAAQKFIPKFSSRYLDVTSKRSMGWYAYTSKISSTGVLGDPTKANREKGSRMWQVMISRLVEFVEDLKNMGLDEIYQRRY